MPTALAQTALMKYTIITQLLEREYSKASLYAKLFNDLGLLHIGFMTGSYPHPYIGNNISIKVCLIHVVLEANFMSLSSPLLSMQALPLYILPVTLFVG